MQASTRVGDRNRRGEVIGGGGRHGDKIHGVEASSLGVLSIGIREEWATHPCSFICTLKRQVGSLCKHEMDYRQSLLLVLS